MQMNKFFRFFAFSMLVLLTLAAASETNAQASRETFTGTVVSFPSGFQTRTRTATFNLIINGRTSDQDAQRFLGVLQENGQDDLLREIDDRDLGRFSVGANVGVPINVVRESVVDGKRRIFVVFERWTQFAELRGGYRSLDYPFGVIELFIDERTGKGEGTYIAAAQIRWRRGKNNEQPHIEIENFATYPARLMGVVQRGGR
jgi:hypothetical protein